MSIRSLKNDDVMIMDDFFDQEAIDWCLWYFEQLEDRRYNNIKYIQETHWNLPFNRWFGNYVRSRVRIFIPDALVHSVYIGLDVRPGGIHTDGWLYQDECELSYKTVLVPLKFNVAAATAVFNERSAQAQTLNQVTGLGKDGITNMKQVSVIDPDQQFDPLTHQRHFQHLDINGLGGLTVHSIIEWRAGQAMSWDRDRWHGPCFFDGINIDRYHVTIMTHRDEKQT